PPDIRLDLGLPDQASPDAGLHDAAADRGPVSDLVPVADRGPVVDQGPDEGPQPEDLGVDQGEPDAAQPAPPWVVGETGCGQGIVVALRVSGGGTIHAGCGGTPDGLGLWRTDDWGAQWAPVEGLGQWRITDLDAAPEGGLFITGSTTGRTNDRVIQVAADGEQTLIYEASNQVGLFQTRHFARLASGVALAHSDSGADVAHRPSDGAPFAGYVRWTTDNQGYQMQALVDDGRAMYAVGSGAGAPPVIFLPAGDGQETPPLFQAVHPLPQALGELVDLAVDGARLLAVGVNRADNGVFVLMGPADAVDAEAWTAVDLSDRVQGRWRLDGACIQGENLMVVGSRADLEGLVFESRDGGRTWVDAAPDDDTRGWAHCLLLEDGTAVLGGRIGRVAVRRP
ncbi:MAG: hypothetical protein KC613_13960, partial [Myxococcales bacterium]|nr:hypothetical protein [Myxococcales bacterium]